MFCWLHTEGCVSPLGSELGSGEWALPKLASLLTATASGSAHPWRVGNLCRVMTSSARLRPIRAPPCLQPLPCISKRRARLPWCRRTNRCCSFRKPRESSRRAHPFSESAGNGRWGNFEGPAGPRHTNSTLGGRTVASVMPTQPTRAKARLKRRSSPRQLANLLHYQCGYRGAPAEASPTCRNAPPAWEQRHGTHQLRGATT
jgi:hypothetical protein